MHALYYPRMQLLKTLPFSWNNIDKEKTVSYSSAMKREMSNLENCNLKSKADLWESLCYIHAVTKLQWKYYTCNRDGNVAPLFHWATVTHLHLPMWTIARLCLRIGEKKMISRRRSLTRRHVIRKFVLSVGSQTSHMRTPTETLRFLLVTSIFSIINAVTACELIYKYYIIHAQL